MKKTALVYITCLVLTGCMASPTKNYFEIYLPKSGETAPVSIQRTILLESVEVGDLYDDFRIIYRKSPYEINYYSYNFWADRPGKMIRETLYRYFKKNNLFRLVILNYSKANTDLVLKSKLNLIEEVDQTDVWYARLAMEFEVMDYKSGDILLTHEFDRREQMPAKQVTDLPVTVSRILEEELTKILKQLAAKI